MKQTLLFIASFLLFINSIAQTHTIEIHPNGRVASILMTPAEYNSWISNDDFNNSTISEPLISDIYQKFEDDFDFIFLILNEATQPSNLTYLGQLNRVSNTIEGTGVRVFDDSSNFGSAGKLKSLMQLTQIDFLLSGPTSHEILHNWGNFVIPSETVSNFGTNLTSFPLGGHWGFTGGNTKGQLGGFDQNTLVDNGNGSYTVDSFGPNANGGNSVPYNDIELYLMGMIPLSEVAAFDGFTTITSIANNGNDTWTFEATKTSYTPASLNTLLENRVPSSTTAQKDFKALVIVITDAPLTTDEWDLLDFQAELYSRNSDDGFSTLYNFWDISQQSESRSSFGWRLYHGCLLVYVLNQFCKSCGFNSPCFEQYFCRYKPRGCINFYCMPVCRLSCKTRDPSILIYKPARGLTKRCYPK